MHQDFSFSYKPLAHPEAVIAGDTWRFTVLTEALIRVEYDQDGCFTDQPTQTVQCREFPPCPFTVRQGDQGLTIETDRLLLTYTGGAFTNDSLSIQFKQAPNKANAWHFGELPLHTLGGTTRTLDRADGACSVGHGLFSAEGWEVLDDSATLLLTEDNWIQPRPKGLIDLYVFGYQQDYLAGLHAFYHLTGATPMLPRFALGNWWSRYYPYSRDSYMALMDRFRQERVPFSVAVIDMDWHLTEVDPKYGTGWTGFTWNRELFPNPVEFMRELHDRGMKITLNLHPADGIRAYEKCYPVIAEHMGVDQEKGEPVQFDVTSRKFMKYYFEDVLHPMEEDGVDFWWIDWQQGTTTRMEGLDPLWMLNHYHFLDAGRDGRRPLTFSRYAGPGSHRYPVGFSGDTLITWASLNFQPYFTNTADNIGYGWWSHDIGGHMGGAKNDELYGRWVQYGVFSPICRLHSSSNLFNGREPWRFRADVCQMAEEFLRLRHRLIPYLYTMNHRASFEGKPLCQPMYYVYPQAAEAHAVPNEYFFGTELLCAPITRPAPEGSIAASTRVWLPQGEWTDFFTGVCYHGGRTMEMYRDINSFPVLAKAGAIIPMADQPEEAALENPKAMTLRIFPGADGAFTLYEDDNTTNDYLHGACAQTDITYREGICPEVRIAARGDLSLLPPVRHWTITIPGVKRAAAVCRLNGKTVPVTCAYDDESATLSIQLPACTAQQEAALSFPDGLQRDDGLPLRHAYRLLDQAELSFAIKQSIYSTLADTSNAEAAASQLQTLAPQSWLLGAMLEMLYVIHNEE